MYSTPVLLKLVVTGTVLSPSGVNAIPEVIACGLGLLDVM